MQKYKPLTKYDKQKIKSNLSWLYHILKKFHTYTVIGLEKLPKNQTYIFVLNHSGATYDMGLFMGYLYLNTKSYPRIVLDPFLLKIPILNYFMSFLKPISTSYFTIKTALTQGESIVIAPGGTKEAIRSSEDKHTLCWENKDGFVRLAIETNTPIILAACPSADDIYDIKKSKLTELIYKKFRFPVVFAKGASIFIPFLPKKIRLTHYLAGPFYPPKIENIQETHKKIEEFHAFLKTEMQTLLNQHK